MSGKVYIRARDRFKFNVLSISGRGAEPAVRRSPLGATYYGSDVIAVTDGGGVSDEISEVWLLHPPCFPPEAGYKAFSFRHTKHFLSVFMAGDFWVVLWLPCLQCCQCSCPGTTPVLPGALSSQEHFTRSITFCLNVSWESSVISTSSTAVDFTLLVEIN